MGRSKDPTLAPGFRFHPTDEELVWYYLRRKIFGKSIPLNAISEIDIYKSEPWDLPEKSMLKSRDLEWYFFSVLDKKYGNGSKTNRATERGYWKTTGKDRSVSHNSRVVAMKKTLVYHLGRAPRGERSNWVMHEYRLVDESLQNTGAYQSAFVLCRVFQKSGSGPKNGEQYGAPFVEEEWDDEDKVLVVPGNDPFDLVTLPDDHVAPDELELDDEDNHTEDPPLSIQSKNLQFIGESSGLKQEAADSLLAKQYSDSNFDADPVENEPNNYSFIQSHNFPNHTDSSQNWYLSENPTHFLDTPYFDEAGISLDNLADPLTYPDEIGIASDHLNEPLNYLDDIDQYATCFDTDDILKFLAPYSPGMAGSDIQENVNNAEVGNNEAAVSSEDIKADEHCKKHPSSDDTVLLSLKANSAAAESSAGVRVTAGVVEILNFRMGEKRMVWSFQKIGGVNAVLSFTVLQDDGMTYSGKRLGGLSVVLLYCIMFWVLNLSLSCKCLLKVTCDC